MLDVVTKSEYFSWLDQRIANRNNHTLKGIQDAWVLSLLWNKESLKIAEIGGGQSRLLEQLSQTNECWNIDKFEGYGAGPTDIPQIPGVKILRSYLGEFNPEIPDQYFDVVFSISVIEHVPKPNLNDFFADCHRILKPGGIILHAIDLYIFDDPAEGPRTIDAYREAVEAQGFIWLASPKIDGSATFKCDYATNSDLTLNVWNRIAPSLKSVREVAQSITIKLVAFKAPEEGTDLNHDFFVVPPMPISDNITASQTKPDGPRPEQITLSPRGSTSLQQTASTPKVEPQSPPQEQPKPVPIPAPQSSETPSARPSEKQKRKHQNQKKNAKAKAARVATTSSTALPEPPSSSVELAASLVGRIINYYSRWPVAIAVLAIALNTTAFLLDEPLQWIFIASGTTLLLFLVGHAASKADYVLDEVEKIRNTNNF
ncbi:MAG: methyltransferase domain-containing protein [Elainellaceae cyanobacterium]